MHLKLSTKPLIGRRALQARIRELASEIRTCYDGNEIFVLVVLKGAVPFSVDLIRQLEIPVCIDYIRARSYEGTRSSGEPVFTHLPEDSLHDRHILLVEDILDTGNTAVAIAEFIRARQPASLRLATLLDKPDRRTQPVTADFVGFTIDDHFVVGYGLDYDERYRELDAIYTLES